MKERSIGYRLTHECHDRRHVITVPPREKQRDAALFGWEYVCSCGEVTVFIPDKLKEAVGWQEN